MKTCEVNIFGQAFSLRADMDEQRVRSIAEMVDGKMRDVAAASPSASAVQIAVLAALDIASEQSVAQGGAGMLAEVDRRVDEMMAQIDEVAPDTRASS